MSNVYISKALRKDIPSNAILLSQEEVINMHWNTIRNWEPSIDVWPFRYGIGMLTATSAATCLSIVKHYRNKMKLNRYGRVTMLLPSVCAPTILANVIHVNEVTNKLFLGADCPLCIETKAVGWQLLSSIVIPAIITPLAGFFYASTYGTYDIPSPRKENIKPIMQLWFNLVRSLRSKLLIAIVANSVLVSGLTYFEAQSFYRCQEVIRERVSLH